MENYDFIERRIRFLRWVFSKEEPWRKFILIGKTIADKINSDLKETLGNTTSAVSVNLFANPYGGYSSTANSSYYYAPNTLQDVMKIIYSANASASSNNTITYDVS